jgi:hypothetical protein
MPRTAAVDEAINNYFANDWNVHDLRRRGVPMLLAGEPVVTDQDFVTSEEMRTHPFYNESLLPFDFFGLPASRCGRARRYGYSASSDRRAKDR